MDRQWSIAIINDQRACGKKRLDAPGTIAGNIAERRKRKMDT